MSPEAKSSTADIRLAAKSKIGILSPSSTKVGIINRPALYSKRPARFSYVALTLRRRSLPRSGGRHCRNGYCRHHRSARRSRSAVVMCRHTIDMSRPGRWQPPGGWIQGEADSLRRAEVPDDLALWRSSPTHKTQTAKPYRCDGHRRAPRIAPEVSDDDAREVHFPYPFNHRHYDCEWRGTTRAPLTRSSEP